MATLLLAIHNHQPVGNLEEVFAMAFRRCYAPVLEIFGRYPSVHVALHYSGPLLDWLESHEPGHLRDLEHQVARGQVELLGGGFYEPLLTVLPQRDVRGQVAMMSDYWTRRTGVRPRGFWLTERIWEPGLPAILAGTDLTYTLVDDSHLRCAGRLETSFSGYYMTEKAGAALAIFPIDKQLRYLIPFAPAEKVIDHLAAQPDTAALTYGDDGEKFGVWPNTHEWVIEKGWLDRFLGLLQGAADRIRTATPGEYLATHPPTDRVYLPTAAYEEMMEWSLPADAIPIYRALRAELDTRGDLDRYGPFVRGGTWEGFFVKYPESNQMHKRMLLVSERLAAAEAEDPHKPLLDEARRALYRSQCNCAYWHGLFGGLYVNYLRHATYAHMIHADRLLDQASGIDGVETRLFDYDRDGHDEILVSSPQIFAIVKPAPGGTLVELDWKPAAFNLLNTIARRREAYHDRPTEQGDTKPVAAEHEPGIPSIHELHQGVAIESLGPLTVDRHLRHSFVDHLWRPDTTLERVEAGEDSDLIDLPRAVYKLRRTTSEPTDCSADLEWRNPDANLPISIRKCYQIDASEAGIMVAYSLRNATEDPREFWFAVELNFSLLAGDASDRYFAFEYADPRHDQNKTPHDRRLASRGALRQLRAVSLIDEHSRLRVRLSSTLPFDLWRFPVETLSRTESGYERSYQESALYCHWRANLEAAKSFDTRLKLTVSPLS